MPGNGRAVDRGQNSEVKGSSRPLSPVLCPLSSVFRLPSSVPVRFPVSTSIEACDSLLHPEFGSERTSTQNLYANSFLTYLHSLDLRIYSLAVLLPHLRGR